MSKEKVDIINLAVDLGNFNIKTSSGIIFPSRFKEGNEINPLNEDIIIYDGKSYVMEKGTFDNKFNKAQKNYLPNLLYAIIKSTSNEDINLMLGFPLDNEGIVEQFKSELMNKSFEFVFVKSGVPTVKKINIHEVGCIGEGVSAFYLLTQAQREQSLIMYDIGGRTTNISIFENKRLKSKYTYPKGTINMFYDIATRYNNANGSNVIVEDTERLVDEGYITGCEVEEKLFLNGLMNFIEDKVDKRTYKNYFTGGGSIRLRKHIENDLNGIIMDDPLFNNCKANKIIADIKWNDGK